MPGGRIQGGWAAFRGKNNSRGGGSGVGGRGGGFSGGGTNNNNVAYKPPQTMQSKYKYDDTVKAEIKVKPKEITINEPGERVLSNGPNAKSVIYFQPHYLGREEADHLFAELSETVEFKQNSDKYGPQPRLTCWYGDLPYNYSQLTMQPNPDLIQPLEDLRRRLETDIGAEFNSVLCNLYRDCKDSVGWHSDDEAIHGRNPTIASISLGETRVFNLRQKPTDGDPMDYSLSQEIKMHLPHGSLVVMKGGTQEDWQHQVPKEYHDKGPRINLTYRKCYPP